MPPIDWQYQLGAIYFNTAGEPDDLGCLWGMGEPDGWASPPVRLTPTDIPYADGANVPDGYWSARTIHGTGLIVAPNMAALEAARRRLLNETRLLRVDGQFIERPLDGLPNRFCTVRRLGPTAFPQRTSNLESGQEAVTFDFQLVAGDPLKYAVIPDVVEVSSSTILGGLSFPWTFPLTFTSDALIDVGSPFSPNTGDVDAPYVASFAGPLVNPVLIDRLSGQRIGLMATIPATRAVVVDTHNETVTIDGDSVDDYLTGDSTPLENLMIPAGGECEWLLLGAGDGAVTVTSAAAFE